MHLGMQQVQKLSQRLIMTPQMQQSVKLLQMNTMELETLVDKELLENPFLEVEEEHIESTGEKAIDEALAAEQSLVVSKKESSETETTQQAEADSAESPTTSVTEASTAEKTEALGDEVTTTSVEEQPEQFEEVDADWKELFEETYKSGTYKAPIDPNEEDRSFEETVASRTSLYDHLMWQLRVSVLTGEDAEMGKFLIGCIDENGFLQTDSTLEECAKKFRLSLDQVNELLELVERLYAEHPEREDLERYLASQLMGRELKATKFLADYLLQGMLQREPTLEMCARKFGKTENEVERVLIIIQEFEPTGVGARDLAETLCLQMSALGELDIVAKETLMDHWDLLSRKKFKEIARLMGESEESIQEVFKKVRKLNHAPGRLFSKDAPIYISPDVYVRLMDGRYVIYLNEGQVAHLRLSKTYRDILARGPEASGNKEDHEYAMEKFRGAINFIKNIEKRRSTILRVTETIMDYQQEFLEKGVVALRPLALAEIAERVSMHESTISRVTSGKYVHTPQGLFELKFFFSSAIRSDRGEAASSRSIRQKIRELIDEENPAKPLSDDKLAKMLKGQGFSIARRTVAKYREQMKILSTNLRRLK